ncbi:hypothetical protein PL11201_520128 [Planktothrix sp. PCC 11201]|nr:hypothetical protein PL11201_520128 [Planktothrix sp. PCC 11201]
MVTLLKIGFITIIKLPKKPTPTLQVWGLMRLFRLDKLILKD